MDEELLTPAQKWEERNFIIISLIRLHSMINLEPDAVKVVVDLAGRVREIESNGGSISEDTIIQKFLEEIGNEQSKVL